VHLALRRTPKNLPAQQFLESLAGERRDNGDCVALRLTAENARAAVWKPAPPPEKPHDRRAGVAAAQHKLDFARIGATLSTPESILGAIRGSRAAEVWEPMNETERRLAVIWADLLGRPSVGLDDNFFDLGGHSLLAVLLVVRVNEALGIELPIDDVYSAGMTLRDLAARIATYQLAGGNPNEYAALLAEIESMSDEEVRRLLEQEDIAGATG
jgi:acyl carrier protein